MEPAESSSKLFKKILFCTDFSEDADTAFDYAVSLAEQNPGSELLLLHVVPESEAQFWKTYIYEVEDVDEKARHDIDEVIDKRYRPRLPQSVPFSVAHRVGSESQEILDYSKQMSVDLIVLGRQQEGVLQKAFLGNIVDKVIRHASCAVMVIPLSLTKKT